MDDLITVNGGRCDSFSGGDGGDWRVMVEEVICGCTNGGDWVDTTSRGTLDNSSFVCGWCQHNMSQFRSLRVVLL